MNFDCKFELMLSAVSAENKECILLGDINCNYLVFSDHKEIKSILASVGLKQLISSPTRITCESKTVIDVICSNEPHSINSMKVIPAGLSDHELIGCARKLNNVKFNPRIITCRNFTNYDQKLFCDDLNSVNFDDAVSSSCAVNKAWTFFRNVLQQCIDKHAPPNFEESERSSLSMVDPRCQTRDEFERWSTQESPPDEPGKRLVFNAF